MKRIMALLILLAMVIPMASCAADFEAPVDFNSITSYRDIPGVTKEEIAAIEALKAKRSSFSYGHLTETEAFILPDGTYAGFTTKFCELLSELFETRFVQQFCEWAELKSNLDNKVIDFTGDLTSTPERMQFYYMTHAIADRSFRIFLNVDSPDIVFESEINGLKVGFLKGAVDAESVAKSYPTLTYQVVECESFAEAAEMLATHEIDVFAIEGIVDPAFDEYDFIRSKEFFPLTFTPVSLTTANPELEPFISVMNKYLVAGGIDKLFELYKQGDDEYATYKLSKSFTNEERAYIDDLLARDGKVRVALEHDNYPVSFYNKSEKEFQGISIDVLEEISRLTGIPFEVATDENTAWAEILEDLKTGEVSMTAQLLYSDARKDDFIWSDVPYCSAYYALLSKTDYPDLSSYQVLRARVGTIKKSAHEDMYNEWFPNNANTVGFDTQNEGLDALEKGEIDLFMASEYILLMQTNYREKPGFKANVRFNTPMDSLFGFHKNEKVLCSIINKAQLYIDTNSITDSWTSRVFDYSKKLAQELNDYLTFFIAALFFVLIFIVILLVKNTRLSKNLEETVKKRTVELENKVTESVRLQQDLEQASKAKSEFLSRMSHEIRTPMNAIIGMTKIADGSNDVEKIKYCLSTINASSEHLLGLINDILDMSKIEAGKFELENERFNIEKMLMKICNLMIDKMEQKKQALQISIGQKMHMHYLGDELRLSQVITNLMSNAVKFTPEEGKIALTVDETESTDEYVTMRFSISDTGIGMTPEQISRLFNSFEQADGSITRRYGGTGLGLAISKNIIEKMGGKIWVESEAQKGSTFIFDIRLKRSASDTSRTIFDSITASEVKLLIVDDSEDIREQFLEIVHNFNMHSDQAESGEKAIALIEKAYAGHKPYDVVFLDSDMPEMDGIETVKRLNGKIDKNTVIIMMTLSQGNELEDIAKSIGIHRFMTKTLFPSAILDAINEVIGNTIKTLDMKASSAKEIFDFSNISLLLVEDVEINREIFIALMEETKVRIDVAENGVEAVQKFKDNPNAYDLILMDVQMPEMDGYEATITIRSLDIQNAQAIPIIAMTANAFKEDIDKCMACGMNDHISKPIDVEHVMAKIKQYSKKAL